MRFVLASYRSLGVSHLPALLERNERFLALVPVYLALIAIFLILNIKAVFNSPVLLLVFNSLFLGLIPPVCRPYRVQVFQGTGILMLGLGAIAAAVINYLPDSMNANITIHNTSFCLGAFLQLVGILIALSGTPSRSSPGDASTIAILYAGSVLGSPLGWSAD